MILQAETNCWLTEAAEVKIENRHFATTVHVSGAKEAEKWRQVTDAEREKMLQQGTIFDVSQLSPAYLDKVETLMEKIPKAMNLADTFADPATALKYMKYYPEWDSLWPDPVYKHVGPGFRLQHNGKLWEVRQIHDLQAEWEPGAQGTEALYEEVCIDHAGTEDDPISYDGNMELFNGKYYSQNGVTYLCNRDTGQAVYHALAELVGLYVEVVEDDSESAENGEN